jgi:hypothetical protein
MNIKVVFMIVPIQVWGERGWGGCLQGIHTGLVKKFVKSLAEMIRSITVSNKG